MNDSSEVDPWKRHISINQFSKKVNVSYNKRVTLFSSMFFPPNLKCVNKCTYAY